MYLQLRKYFHGVLLNPSWFSGLHMYRTVVTICTAQWSLYVPPVVTICTAQWSLYVPPVVTICTAQWSLYVPHSGHYMYRQWSLYVKMLFRKWRGTKGFSLPTDFTLFICSIQRLVCLLTAKGVCVLWGQNICLYLILIYVSVRWLNIVFQE